MLTESGKPRYWVSGYDTWHLLLLPVAAILVAWLAMARPAHRRPLGPVPTLRAASPTIIQSPAPGTIFIVNHWGDVEGVAEPGARLTLQYRTLMTPEAPLAASVAGRDGRFRFHLLGFPPGSYGVRVFAELPDGRTNSSLEAPFRVAPEPAPAGASNGKSRKKPAKSGR
jgi:hypothetical protein